MLAIRVNSEGAVDPAFGTHGVALTDTSLTYSAANDFAAMADGSLVLAGHDSDPGTGFAALVRMLPDGKVDTTFGSAGILRFAVATTMHGQRQSSFSMTDLWA